MTGREKLKTVLMIFMELDDVPEYLKEARIEQVFLTYDAERQGNEKFSHEALNNDCRTRAMLGRTWIPKAENDKYEIDCFERAIVLSRIEKNGESFRQPRLEALDHQIAEVDATILSLLNFWSADE